MTKGKLKNLILLLLVVTNGLLLWLATPLIYQGIRLKDAQSNQLSSLFTQYNVDFNPEILPQPYTLYPVELAVDALDYESIAQKILGDDVVPSSDGGQQAQVFTSPSGTCTISRDTSFYVEFWSLAPVDDMENQVSQLLTQLNIQGEITSATWQEDDVYTISVVQTLFGTPYFSSKLDFVFQENALTQCSGNAIFDTTAFTRPDDDQCIGNVDALVAFFASRNQLGWVGSSITQISQGFYRTDLASANLIRLTPGWKITTDTGDFWVNGMTSGVSSLEVQP